MRLDIFRLTIRQLLGFHRIGLLVLALFVVSLPIIAAGAEQAINEGTSSGEPFLVEMFVNSQMPIFYPIVILFLAALALREEIDNNTIVYLWTKPISRASIVISKYAAAFVVAAILCGLSAGITSLMVVSGNIALALSFVLATLIGLLAYGALYFTISLVAGRTVSIILGLAYTIIWEGLLSSVSSLTANLSIRHYATNFAMNVIDANSSFTNASLSMTTSLFVLLAISLVLLFLSILRFSRMEFAGES